MRHGVILLRNISPLRLTMSQQDKTAALNTSLGPDPQPVYLHEMMGMELIDTEPGTAKARLEVLEKVCQPFGFLSGGASLALAETLAGHGSLMLCASDEIPFGIQVSANHIHAVPMGGCVTATASLLQKSRHLHVWNVDIVDEGGRLVSSCRVTNCIKKRNPS